MKYYLQISLIATISLSLFSCGNKIKKRQLAFINPTDKELNIVIERNEKYIVDKQVPAHGMAYDYVEVGKAKILTFDGENCTKLIKEYDIKADSTSGYLCFDLEGKVNYAIVSSSYLYSASNSLSQSISDAGWGNKMNFYGPIINSEKPFNLTFAPIWPYDKLPKEIGALSAGWALVPITIPTDDKVALAKYIDTYFRSLSYK